LAHVRSFRPILSMRLAYALSMALTFPTTFFVVR
jgi:hypothetical protein